MATCDYCSKSISWTDVWSCKYCGGHFCGKHRLPESHKCEGNPQNPHWGRHRETSRPRKFHIFPRFHKPRGVIEKDSMPRRKRKRHRHFRGGHKKTYSVDLKYFLFIFSLFVVGFLIFSNFDRIASYFQPEEIEKEELISEIPEEEVIRVPGKTLLAPVEEPSCQEVYAKPDKTKVIKSLCSDLCETKEGEFLGQSSCMGDKKLYCKCQLYEEIIVSKEIQPAEEVVQEVSQEPSKGEKISELKDKIVSKIEEEVEDIFSGPEPVSEKTYEIERAIFKYTNIERREHGVSELRWDDQLSEIAREHSLDMVTNDFFSHTNLKGEDPTDRAVRKGYNVHKELGGGWYSDGIAENIGQMPTGDVLGYGYVSSDSDSIAKAHVESWMGSTGHRENILNNQYDLIGVGVAYDGLYYTATQNFK